jgi:hypothetical protein
MRKSSSSAKGKHVLKKATRFIGFCLFLGISSTAAHAQTINAASCNLSDVQSALSSVNQATATVVIPAGTCSWSSALSYAVPSSVTSLTIQGQTTVNCTGTAGTSSYACTSTDTTVLVDSYSSAGQAIWNLNIGSAAFRITGITFKGGTVSAGVTKPNGFITFTGSSQSLRMDHCHFNTSTYNGNIGGGATIFSPIAGVFDHDLFDLVYQNNGIRTYAGSGDFGDALWSQATNFGGSNFIFIENTVFKGGFVNDCNNGGRMVVRYTTYSADPYDYTADSGGLQTHAMGQGVQRERGCRAMEEYHNYVYNPTPSTPQYSAADGNSGTGLRWGNTIGTGYNNDIVLQEVREVSSNNCGGGSGNLGACQAPATGVGYCGSNSSGATSPWDGNSVTATGYPCINQTGRGQGDLLNGANFPNALNTVTNSISWPHNKREPWYVWNETIAAGNVSLAPGWNGVSRVANRDFYSQVSANANTTPTSPFNGTTGTGFGTLANRPTTCTAGPGGTYDASPTGSYGVAYFATDASGGNGELYVCTSTNTWTAIYSPYTYPHPLVVGGTTEMSGSPNPPTGLVATVQ